MARWNDLEWTPEVLKAAELWRDRCFNNDGSLFSDEKLWTLENIQELNTRLSSLRKDKETFFPKLQKQLAGAEPDIYRLATEILWLTYLFQLGKTVITPDSNRKVVANIGFKSKRESLNKIMSSCDLSLPTDLLSLKGGSLSENTLSGIGNSGFLYSLKRPFSQLFFLNLLCDWKALSDQERKQFKQDDTDTAWHFAEYCDQFLESDLYKPYEALPFRHALLFFLHPDYFERMVSNEHKVGIVEHFKIFPPDTATKLPVDLVETDKAIYEIRQELAKEHGEKIDFYLKPIQVDGQWIDAKIAYEKYRKAKTQLSSSTPSSQSSPPTSADETPSADDMINGLIDPEKFKAKEGNPKLVTHYVKERSPSLRKAKINQFLSKHSTLSCESCCSDASQYPEECRKRVFEVHHKKRLADIDNETEMTVDDLAILCANCHNAIHATQDLLDVEEFKQLLKSKCAGET